MKSLQLHTTDSTSRNNLVFYNSSSISPEDIDYSDESYFTFIDEFGPIVREVRHIEVDHDITPAISAYVFTSNEDRIDVIRHRHDGFRSEFFLMNRGRNLAVANGEDTHAVENETINQQILLYGLVVKREDEKTEEVLNEQSIRARGVQELNFSSPWIQKEEQATEIATFITGRWGEPADILNVTVIPNPALTTGDVVSVDYPDKGMNASTHKYHIISINFGYDAEQGFSQELKLRRYRD